MHLLFFPFVIWILNPQVEGKAERIITTLESEKEEVEASLNKEKIQTLQLKEELAEIDTRNTELYKVTVLLPSLISLAFDPAFTRSPELKANRAQSCSSFSENWFLFSLEI